MTLIRCAWCTSDPLYIDYHDSEWGVVLHDDRALFEMLILEGAQAGLSWLTILKKRPSYRSAFDNFDVNKIARYGAADRDRLIGDNGIVRNRLKIEAVIKNARGVITIIEQGQSLDHFLWRYVDHSTIHHHGKTIHDVPTRSQESEMMSKDLKRRGFNFVGPTICYAFMQATGMVNDHTIDCFRHRQLLT
jgi:DNA-3-methyladenine glycosylase I